MANGITITDDNAAEVLEAAATAVAEADGTAPVEAAPTDPPAEETPPTEEAPKAEGLEIEETPETPATAEATEALDLESYYAEYAENGALSDESRSAIVEALTNANIANPENLLDQYIAGATASAAAMQRSSYEAVGGEEQYRAMQAWAAENMTSEEKAAYNAAVANPALATLAVRGLYSQFQADSGNQNTPASPRVQAGANQTGGFEPIRNLIQVSQITADPRYDRDPAWRAQQDARIQASMKAGLFED